MAAGERNGAAKLTEANVRQIRHLRQQGWKRKAIANQFGVGEYTIRDIMDGRTWGWLS